MTQVNRSPDYTQQAKSQDLAAAVCMATGRLKAHSLAAACFPAEWRGVQLQNTAADRNCGLEYKKRGVWMNVNYVRVAYAISMAALIIGLLMIFNSSSRGQSLA